jgi:hypothetical protein
MDALENFDFDAIQSELDKITETKNEHGKIENVLKGKIAVIIDRDLSKDETFQNEADYHKKERATIADEGNLKVEKMTETDKLPIRNFRELLQNKYKNPFDVEKTFVFLGNGLFLFAIYEKSYDPKTKRYMHTYKEIDDGYFNDFKVYEDQLFDKFTKAVQEKSEELQTRAFWFHPKAHKYTVLGVESIIVAIWKEYEELIYQPRQTLEFFQQYVAYNWFFNLVQKFIDEKVPNQRLLTYSDPSIKAQLVNVCQNESGKLFQSIFAKIRERYMVIKAKMEVAEDVKKRQKVFTEIQRSLDSYKFKEEVKVFAKEEV